MTRTPDVGDAFRRKLCDWLRANDIDPGRVPANSALGYANGQITYERVVLSPLTQSPQIDPADPLRLVTETVTVPMLVEPGPDLALVPREACPACGAPVLDWESEPLHETTDRGFRETMSIATTFKPCGHTHIHAVR